MKKKLIVIFTLSLLLATMFSSNALAITTNKSEIHSGLRYVVSTTTVPIRSIPIIQTQVLHNYGISSTVSTSTTYTKSLTASSSLSVGATYFVTMTYSIGITSTESCSVSAGVSFTIPSSTPTGFYRITTRFPSSSVIYDTWNSEPARIYHYSVSYAPDANTSYYECENYQ